MFSKKILLPLLKHIAYYGIDKAEQTKLSFAMNCYSGYARRRDLTELLEELRFRVKFRAELAAAKEAENDSQKEA